MRKNDVPFKHLNLKSKLTIIISISMIFFIGLSIFLFAVFFGAIGFFRIFDVSYASYTSISLFIFVCFLVGGVFEVIGKILITIASISIEHVTLYFCLKFMIDLIMNLLTFHIADQFVNDVLVPSNALLIAAIFLSIAEAVFDMKYTNQTD
ncbi:YrvL family regulatory protein [Bacillus sp. CLL-7-23]|uniref:YrvL family regulatory protein n=1 Tax=Bacillus changyiensis TaxID=3004103 RepID=A0ABT4X2X0_9BACI|nr:YrvL family regulatory protein [Bacillus changyiensis]MDA7025747.1 YrvL family regulatory protein [Bacillus changyiensis]